MNKPVLKLFSCPFLIGSTCSSNNDAYVAPGFGSPQNSSLKNGSMQILETLHTAELSVDVAE